MVGSVFRGTAVIGYFSSATLASTRWDFHPPLFLYIFIYLAVPGLSCGTQDLHFVAACGI